MRTGFTKSSVIILQVFELIGGISAALLGLFLFGRIFVQALSLGEPLKPSTDAIVFLMLALPGIVIAVGSYLQAVRRNDWGVILILIGTASNVAFVVLNAGLAYALIQDPLGRLVVQAVFLMSIFTVGAAFVNTMLSLLLHRRVQ